MEQGLSHRQIQLAGNQILTEMYTVCQRMLMNEHGVDQHVSTT